MSDSTSQRIDPDMVDAPRIGIVRRLRGNYWLPATLTVGMAVVLGATQYFSRHGSPIEQSGIPAAPVDEVEPEKKRSVMTMPPLPKSLRNLGKEKPPETPAANPEMDELREVNRQLQADMLALQHEMLEAKAERKRNEQARTMMRWQSPVLQYDSTVPHTRAPTLQEAALARHQPDVSYGDEHDGLLKVGNGDGDLPEPGTELAAQLAGYSPPDSVQSHALAHPWTWLTAGTMIPILPTTAINTERAGMVKGKVDRDIYAKFPNQYGEYCLLVPKNSEAIGDSSAHVRQAGRLINVMWRRITAPDGTIVYANSPGADAVGRAGFEGLVDYHFMQKWGAPILLSLLSIETDSISDSRGEAIASSTSDAVEILLKDSLGIEPTVYMPHTHQIVTMFLARDLDFSRTTKCL